MGTAQLSSKRSKDPKTQVGACIVNHENKIVGIGYNGFPKGISDDDFPWQDQGEYLQTKYPFVVHAEANAILNASQNLNDCKLFVTLFPCNECTKIIIQSVIKELVYVSNKDEGKDFQIASRKMLEKAQVKLRQISWESINV